MLGEKVKYLSEYDWAMIWPKVSVVLFTIIFLFIVFMVIRFKKKDVEEWEAMPLNDGNDTDTENNHSN